MFQRLRGGVPRTRRQPWPGRDGHRVCGGNRGSAPLASLPEEPPLHPTAAGRSRRTGDAHPEHPGCGGGREQRQPGLQRPFAPGVCLSPRLGTRGHHQHPLCTAIPSPLFSSPQGTQGRLPGHRMEGWESSRLLASKPTHGTCSRVPFSGPAFVGAKYSHILAARYGKTGDCTEPPAWSSPDGPVYRDVVWDEAELIPCLFSAGFWRALSAQERS